MHHSLLNFVLNPENVKRLQPGNAAEVEKLTLKNTEYLFGDETVEKHLDRHYLSLGIYNESDQLAGVLCLDCHPNIPALPPWEWDYFLYNNYKITDVIPMTTLWIHYAVWDRRYTTLFLNPMLQHVFQSNEALEKVIMVCPPGISRLDFIEAITERVLPVSFSNPQKVQTLFIAKRSDFVAQYVIRRAVEEDNDDLVAIIPKVVKENYGNYYISEILSNKDSKRQIIVAEYQGCAVGVLCLNEEVNYDLLNKEFELVPYNGLKKRDAADKVVKPTMVPTPSSMFIPEEGPERLSLSIIEDVKEEVSLVRGDEEENLSEDDFSLLNISSSLILNLLYDEEDVSDHLTLAESVTSIESHFSAVVLNEEYEDHLYNAERGDAIEGELKQKSKDSRQDASNISSFHGGANAFTMEICTAVGDHENCLYLLFQAAFECFPHRDYIVVSFPTDSELCYLSKHFARVMPRPSSVFTHELYVLHKNAILGKLWVRPASSDDKAAISELVVMLLKPSVVEEAFKEAVDFPTCHFKAYTFLCERQIIGCAIVSEEEEHEFLELHYNIDPWMDTRSAKFGTIGNLEQFLLSPIFGRHLGFFARELHRLSNFDAIFYRLKRHDYMYTSRSLPIVNAISNMIPLVPNPLPQYSKQILEEFQLPHSLEKHHQPFGLYLCTVRLTSMEKVEINQKIVVAGASSTSMSFLETLIFGQNPNYLIIFTNVTVISPHGIAYHKQPSNIRDMIFVRDGHLDRRYIDSICLKTYVNVIQGVMTAINRKEKYVGLNDDTYIPYDYLILLCGEQFQKPPVKKKEVIKKRTDFPLNVFIINTEADAGNALNALKNLNSGQKQGTMVVFGHHLEACCCLAALLEFGVSGNNLVYVDPSPDHIDRAEPHDHITQFFNNSTVETAVLDEILLQGVTIYQDFNFVEWHFDSTHNFITSAKFESKYKFVEIELSALFMYHSKGVSARTFQAISRSGLVFNGRLVIDKNYQTNDPYIYGAGPLTMYSKRYHAEHLMHKFYNSCEIGSHLGQEMRRKLVPEKYWDPPSAPLKLNKPVVKFCKFPGNLYYLHVTKAGEQVPLDVATIKCNYGRVLTTGDCKKLDQKGYFRLHLNQFQTVETITCLSKSELHVRNLVTLWGKHEILLNHLLLRYDMSMISDLFDHFDQPWAAAIYHKDFHKVLEDIAEMFATAETDEGVKIIDEVKSRLISNEWSPLSKLQMDEIEEMCRDTNLIPMIEEKVMVFLHDNYMYLPMYVHQLLIRWIMHQVGTSPLFVRTTFLTIVDTKSASRGMPFFQRATSHSRNLSREVMRFGH